MLQGWFDGLGEDPSSEKGDSSRGGKGGRGKGTDKAGDKAKRKGGAAGRESPSPSNLFSRLAGSSSSSNSRSSKGGSKSAASGKRSERQKRDDTKGTNQDKGVTMQALSAVGESFAAGAAAFQERFAQTSPQNVTFIWGGGSVTNFTVPWKGLGLYTGGVVSGLALAVGLLTVPYTELGSPGLRKSLTLFENVLVDIDQVRRSEGWASSSCIPGSRDARIMSESIS